MKKLILHKGEFFHAGFFFEHGMFFGFFASFSANILIIRELPFFEKTGKIGRERRRNSETIISF